MEYVSGGDLCSLLKSHKHGRLKETRALPYCAQIVSALHYMHSRGVVHRDLKVENIMLSSNRDQIKIVDFGLSNKWSYGHPLRTNCGSPEYAAPELFNAHRAFGPEIDVWSVGVVFYVILVGRLPFVAPKTSKNPRDPATVDSGADKEGQHRHRRQQKLVDQIRQGLDESHAKQCQHLSNACVSLLHGLLEPDINTRLTVAQICTHAWLSSFRIQEESHSDCPSESTHQMALKSAAALFNISKLQVLESVKRRAYNNFAGAYNILINKKRLLKDLEACAAISTDRNKTAAQRSGRHFALGPSPDSQNLSVVVSNHERSRQTQHSPPNHSHLPRHWKQLKSVGPELDERVGDDGFDDPQELGTGQDTGEVIWKVVSSSSNVSDSEECELKDFHHVFTNKLVTTPINSKNELSQYFEQYDKEEGSSAIIVEKNRSRNRVDEPCSKLYSSTKQNKYVCDYDRHQIVKEFNSDEKEMTVSFGKTSLQSKLSPHHHTDHKMKAKLSIVDKSNHDCHYNKKQDRYNRDNMMKNNQTCQPPAPKHQTGEKTGVCKVRSQNPPPSVKRCQSECLATQQQKAARSVFGYAPKPLTDAPKRSKQLSNNEASKDSNSSQAANKVDVRLQRAHRSLEHQEEYPRYKSKLHSNHINSSTKSGRALSCNQTEIGEMKMKSPLLSYRTHHKV